jgi:phage tail tape-measure protein
MKARGRRTPPHDHGTWATILLLSGEEKNTLYRTEDGRLRKASEVTLKPGAILAMRAETAHVVECVGNAPTIGLHVYGGDIFELPRRTLTGAPGAHPVGAGLGAAAGGIATGAAVGTIAGPVGRVVGAAVGAVVGGLAGKAIGEAIDPTAESAYWQKNYSKSRITSRD